MLRGPEMMWIVFKPDGFWCLRYAYRENYRIILHEQDGDVNQQSCRNLS